MIDLIYTYKGAYMGFDLYAIINGEKKFIENFADREDLLIYIEKNYNMANLKIINLEEEED